MMVRRFRPPYRRSRPVKSVRYSNETSCVQAPAFTLSHGATANTTIISAVASQGTRKTKNYTLRLQSNLVPASAVIWAILYIPQGFPDTAIQLHKSAPETSPPASLFEPNQNVVMSGYLPTGNEGSVTYRSRLARNLESGDRIVIAFYNPHSTSDLENLQLGFTFNYVVAY
jgi:hypothetical protein